MDYNLIMASLWHFVYGRLVASFDIFQFTPDKVIVTICVRKCAHYLPLFALVAMANLRPDIFTAIGPW